MTSPARTSPTTTTVVVPGAHLTTALLGPRDHVLRRVEQQFPTTQISVRGNEVRIGGDDTAAISSVAELFEQFGNRGDRRRVITPDAYLVAAHADLRGRELLLDPPEHVVPRTEERRGEVSAGNDHGRGRG